MSLTLTRQWSVTTHAYQFMTLAEQAKTDPRMQKLLEETRGLVKKWEKTGLLDGLRSDLDKTDMAILLPPQSSLHFDDGTVITYETEEEKEAKLKEYYERVEKNKT